MPALPTVIPVTESVTTVSLAAVKNARPVVCRNPVAYVVLDGVAMRSFLDNAGQEPASGSEVRNRGVEHVLLLVFAFELGRGCHWVLRS